MEHPYSSWLPCRLPHPLLALGLLLAPAGAAQAQTPTATFAAATTYGTGGSSPISIAVADVNADGKPDLLTVNNGNSNTAGVLLGNGNGTFQAATTYSTGTNSNPYGIAVADVNGDGKLDLLTANGSATAGVLLGNGNGTFQPVATYNAGSFAYNIAVADVNGDSKPDLLTGNFILGSVGVLLGNGNGTFQAATTYSAGSSIYSIAVADVNGDGKLDLLTAKFNDSTAGVLLGNGNGTFQAVTSYSTGNQNLPYGIAAADVNGDGKPDLLTANNNSSTAAVLLGNGNGTFQAATNYSTGTNSNPGSIAVADVNGDGKFDLLTANRRSNTAGVLLGNGNGTFQAATTYGAGTNGNPYGIAVADVNGDGKPDLLTANFNSNTVGVLLNTTVYAPTLTSVNPTSALVGTSVTLTGTNLTGATAVSFNGTAATTFTVVNGTTIMATVPTGATSGNVTVTTPGGTSGGVAFTVLTTPTVLLTAPANISTTSALVGGSVTADGGTAVTSRGVVYSSTAAVPTVGGAGVTTDANGAGVGTYSKTIMDLLPGTTYTLRAYATNNAGTSYSSAVSFTTLLPVTLTTWTGTVSTDWFTAGNWSAGVPTATIDVLIPAGTTFSPQVATGTAAAKNLTLDNGATLSQSGGTLSLTGNLANNGTFAATGGTVATSGDAAQTLGGSSPLPFQSLSIGAAGAALGTRASFQRVLTLTGDLATNGQPLTLLSRTSGGVAQDGAVVNNGGVVVGTATVQRAIDSSVNLGSGYRHYSAPVSNSTVADLATPGFQPTVNPAYNTSATPDLVVPFPTMFGHDDSRLSLANSLPAFDRGFFSPAALADPLAVGRGYAVNLSASEVVDFQGTLNNGTLTLPLTSTRATYPDGGWQFLGNPYPAPLDYSRVTPADRVGLESAIYVYTSTNQYQGRYRTYVNGIGNPVLPISQGFFARVAAGQASATVTFRNSQRLTVPGGTTFQRPAADTRPLVQLTLEGVGTALADEAYVYFEPGAGSSFEPAFDAQKLPNPTGLNLSTRLADGQQLSIDGQPELGANQRVVPLAVGVPAPGVYRFIASQVLNLSAVPTHLRDRELNTLTDLRQQPTYQFTVVSALALNASRFELVFSPQQVLATVPAALAQQVAIYPNPTHTQVSIELPLSLTNQAITASLLDALGRVVRQQLLPAGGATHALPLAEIAPGVYSLRLATAQGTVVRKLVVE